MYIHKSVTPVIKLHTAAICDCVKKKFSGSHGNLNSSHWQNCGGGVTRWRNLLRHCVTSQKVAGSIPDGVTEIFY